MHKLILSFCAVLLLGGCSFAPEYERPALDLPLAWADGTTGRSLELQWWKRFNDPVLDGLVDEALLHNQDMAVAMARVDQARAYLGLARAERFPTLAAAAEAGRARPSLDASGSYGLARGLHELSNAVGAAAGQPPQPFRYTREGEQYGATLQALWELDLWGKYRNSAAAARERLLASEAARQGALLGLAGQTCLAYFNLRNYDLQLSIAERTLETRTQALNIYQARYDEGLISELDLLRAKTEVDTMRANIYTAQYQVETAESALLLLAGRSPRAIFEDAPERGLTLEAMPSVPQLPAGLPSDLLERRPDIIAAEAMLKASNFQIGVARANFFPSISLTGQMGSQSFALENLFQGSSAAWSYGAGLSVPLLTFGRVTGNLRVSEAQTREAVAAYSLAVQQAFQEVRAALAVQARTVDIADTLATAVANLRQAVDLANLRYENGYAAYLEVLDAERSLFEAEIQLANVRNGHLASIVSVCMALGGGWEEAVSSSAQ